VAVPRTVGSAPGDRLAALLAGPTPQEQARGIFSAIPPRTSPAGLDVRADRTVIVYLDVPAEHLRRLDADTFEAIVQQLGATLEPLGWRDLRIQARDPATGAFVPLASFLPALAAPRKPDLPTDEEGIEPELPGQPPAPGQGQPQGALSGRTVYVSAGHGWVWNANVNSWRTQRPPYPAPPYVGPIIEDHNNAEVVNQYLLQYLWNAGAQVIPVRERDMNAAERIVNNDDLTGYAEQGTWATSDFPGYDLNIPGQTYRFAMTVAGTATATATWTVDLPADGRYAVYVWYRHGSNRAADARYTVHHAGGETTVVADQRSHGLTWHYIGTYGFRAGEPARVTLTNASASAGQAVIADAVRFGGGTFDSLEGIETIAPYPPDKPWWEAAAYYYTQRMGMEAADSDVVARPLYARWEHAGSGDDAVYISWHTNGYSGYQQDYSGTITYIYNGEVITRPVTPGSAELRHAIHSELINDIRAGWDPAWVDGGERSLNLGELRELWDDDPAARMPGALIELAYHDHPTDTDALKHPYFEMLAARAVYQGIVRYFEARDGADLALLPEPPTHLALENLGDGRVRVSWQPPPTDTLGLVGDAATGYRVYTSPDGLGWSNGVPVSGTATILNGVGADGRPPLLFVRVTATNAGGESFPTETLAVRVTDEAHGRAPLLLVNGFDRVGRSMLVPETDPAEGFNLRMFLDRANRHDYAIQHGTAIPIPFDSASNEAVRDGPVTLSRYPLTDWLLGEESGLDQTLDAAERALLRDYLQGGGALFISGSEIGWDLDYRGADPGFYHTVLRADYAGDDAETYAVVPVPGSFFDGLPPFRFDAPGMYDADYPDQLTPLNGSLAVLSYQGGLGGTAAISYAEGSQRLVYFGFPFETIWPEQRAMVMSRVLWFLGGFPHQAWLPLIQRGEVQR